MATTDDNTTNGIEEVLDLVGGPFSVIESDPGVFTTLIRRLGIKHLQFEEVYDIQTPYALSSIKPKGLVLCFMWKHDKHHPAEFNDPAANQIWFANQLSDDSCASLAILNVLFNCLDVDVGEELKRFKEETDEMSSVMKGLAITNLHSLRSAQNSLARPSDVWASISSVAKTTALKPKSETTMKKDEANKSARSRPRKRVRKESTDPDSDSPPTAASRQKSKQKAKNKNAEEEGTTADDVTYHFIGYVPARGKVWELDGFKAGPLEVGEVQSLPLISKPSSSRPTAASSTVVDTTGWEEVVLPALKMKMESYGSSADGNIQFSLLALVEDKLEAKWDELELARRRVRALERRLLDTYGDRWKENVHPELLPLSEQLCTDDPMPSFRVGFAAQQQDQDLCILEMPEGQLVGEWENSVRKAKDNKDTVDEEVQTRKRIHTDHVKRTHNYDEFVRQFVTELQAEGRLRPLLKRS